MTEENNENYRGNKNAEKEVKRSTHLHQRHLEDDMAMWRSIASGSGLSFTQWVRETLNKEIKRAKKSKSSS